MLFKTLIVINRTTLIFETIKKSSLICYEIWLLSSKRDSKYYVISIIEKY